MVFLISFFWDVWLVRRWLVWLWILLKNIMVMWCVFFFGCWLNIVLWMRCVLRFVWKFWLGSFDWWLVILMIMKGLKWLLLIFLVWFMWLVCLFRSGVFFFLSWKCWRLLLRFMFWIGCCMYCCYWILKSCGFWWIGRELFVLMFGVFMIYWMESWLWFWW